MTEVTIHASELITAYKALCCRHSGDHRKTADAARALVAAARHHEVKAFWHYIAIRADARAAVAPYKPCGGCGRKA